MLVEEHHNQSNLEISNVSSVAVHSQDTSFNDS
jgi:hypothetical protein